MHRKPEILLTCGDPNGIGPEIALKILGNNNIKKKYSLKVLIPENVLAYYCKKFKLKIPSYDEILFIHDFDLKVCEGKSDKNAGRIAGDAVQIGTELCLNGKFDALVTMPISKHSLSLAGYAFTGHTEFLKALTKSKDVIMIMYSEKLSVMPVTIHIPAGSIAGEFKKELLKTSLELLYKTYKEKFGIDKPRIAMLSLNPHNGDGGLLGSEEINIINPVLNSLGKKNIKISGPYAADGFFGSGNYKNFDVVAGAYHDQVLIPFKLLSGKKGVNYTAGIPIIRTSPGHGTAFDIAGKGIADIESSIEAIKLAGKLINRK
ncbi:MAG: 4-hydroxythreonine-4-phosphate dehydrogenase PdxA [Ignavibacteria bacterium]|nr:4-hydroxythreonine-4-phosphate dehydrogenase PdxA [Ignavibacteria bacterium]